MARSAVLLKPNIANNLLFNFCAQKFVQHGPITIAIDCNGLSLLIFEEKWPNYASGTKFAPNSDTRFGCVGFSMYAFGFSVSQMRHFCLFTYPPRSKWASSEMNFFAKIGIFYKSFAGSLREAKMHWIVNWLQLLNQLNFVWRHTKVLMKNSSQLCLRNVQLLRTTVNWCWWRLTHTFCHSSNILGYQFLSLFSQDSEHTELKELLFFKSPYAIFTHILQHYHDCQSNVAIFSSIVQAYTQSYSFGGRIKLIICQIRHELSVIIQEISTSWKKTLRWRTLYYNNIIQQINCFNAIISFMCTNYLTSGNFQKTSQKTERERNLQAIS